ncbi:hypothetical protein [Thalassotalea piscium]|uniref:Uncharacterized protein n=1 Tax=Thalassotalea piscium TaxID=1230533 RepID=A0A7X0NK13_9GAMM|nr:hypothetical protein [Thalassotalea piscium]MBB6544808.1 hypothetical protein [Thalassotalea piscium]
MWAMLEHNCPEQLVMKINALYLTVFTAYKIDHLFNETGINTKQTVAKTTVKDQQPLIKKGNNIAAITLLFK